MADIELVIKIPEEDYKNCIKYDALTSNICKAIQRGTLLPKGATNGDMIKALFGENALITLDTHNYLKDWWNALYKVESEG